MMMNNKVDFDMKQSDEERNKNEKLTGIIDILTERYPEGSTFSKMQELKEANPDLAPRFKSLANQSRQLFGMPLGKYLKKIGILVDRFAMDQEQIEEKQNNMRADADKEMIVSSDDSDRPKNVKSDIEKLEEIIEPLKERYASGERIAFSVAEVRLQNPDLPIASVGRLAKKIYGQTATQYLTGQGIISDYKDQWDRYLRLEREEHDAVVTTEVSTLAFQGEVFVFDHCTDFVRLGTHFLSYTEFSEWGKPQCLDGNLNPTDAGHPIGDMIREAGGIVEAGITKKTDYYVIGEGEDSIAHSCDLKYLELTSKGVSIAAITLDNLKRLLGIENVDFSNHFSRIEINETEDASGRGKTDPILIEERDLSEYDQSDWLTRRESGRPLHLHDYIGKEDSITLPAFSGMERIESLGKFEKCTAKTIYIPGSYKRLSDWMLQGNLFVEEVYVGEGVEEIGDFFCCAAKNLKRIHLPGSIRKVGYCCFEETAWSVSQEGDEIIDGVFLRKKVPYDEADKKKTLILPNGVRCIAAWPFNTRDDNDYGKFDHIREVQMPSSLEYIGEKAFHGLSCLEMIRMPSGVQSIGEETFLGTRLEEYYKNNSKDHMLIAGDILCEIFDCGEELMIPEGVRVIADEAMGRSNSTPEYIHLPKSAEVLGRYPFGLRIGGFDKVKRTLKHVDLNEGLKIIGESCFEGMVGLNVVSLPETLQRIGERAFCGSGLQRVKIPGNVKEIGPTAFCTCRDLQEVIINDGVERISRETFRGCASLRSISLPGTLRYIGSMAFEGCRALERIDLPDSLEFVAEDAFNGCDHLHISATEGTIAGEFKERFEEISNK